MATETKKCILQVECDVPANAEIPSDDMLLRALMGELADDNDPDFADAPEWPEHLTPTKVTQIQPGQDSGGKGGRNRN